MNHFELIFLYFNFIGGMIDGKMMSVMDIEEYAELQSLEHSRSKLCGLLSTATSSTYHLLSKPATILAQSLNQYVNDNEKSVDKNLNDSNAEGLS